MDSPGTPPQKIKRRRKTEGITTFSPKDCPGLSQVSLNLGLFGFGEERVVSRTNIVEGRIRYPVRNKNQHISAGLQLKGELSGSSMVMNRRKLNFCYQFTLRRNEQVWMS